MLSYTIALIIALVCLSYTPSIAKIERYEFSTGESICLDKRLVIKEVVSASFGSDNKLVSIAVRLDSTVIELTPDKLMDKAYFRDLAAFVEAYPESVSLESSADLLIVDAMTRPSTEIDSMRLLDLLVPGDGTMSYVVSNSLRELVLRPTDEQLAEIFLAICWHDRSGELLCKRQFPIYGFRAGYFLGGDWEEAIEKDPQIRSHLKSQLKRCH